MASKNKEENLREYYSRQIDLIADMIKERKEDILSHFDTGVVAIDIYTTLDYTSIPTLEVTKKYLPKEVTKICLLNEELEETN